jgi:hypothetical protein
MSGPTIVVSFGDSVDSDALFVVELDDTMNLDDEGNIKTSFFPGDYVYFLMHYDPNLVVTSIQTTSGQVELQGRVSRENTMEIFFQDSTDEHDLTHNPSSHPTGVFDGRQSSIIRSGRKVKAASTPCIGDITYSYSADLARFIPPTITLEEGEQYRVGIVIHVEER